MTKVSTFFWEDGEPSIYDNYNLVHYISTTTFIIYAVCTDAFFFQLSRRYILKAPLLLKIKVQIYYQTRDNT